MNPKIDYREFITIEGIWNSVCSGNLHSISIYNVTEDDLKMLEKLFRFRRDIIRENIKFVYKMVSIDDINILKEYLDYFGIENNFDKDSPTFFYLYRMNNRFDETDDINVAFN